MRQIIHKFRRKTCLSKLATAASLVAVGGAAAAFLPAGAAAGSAVAISAAVGSILGNVGGNLITNCIDRWFPENSLAASDKLNHDVELLIGKAIAAVTQERVNHGSPHAAVYKALLKADVAEVWQKMMLEFDEQTALELPNPQELMVAAAEARVTGSGDKLPPCMDADTWTRWLVRLDSRAGIVLPADALADDLAPALVRRFYWHLVEALKEDFESGGKAYAALQLAATHETLYLLRMNAAQLTEMNQRLDRIEQAVAAKVAAFQKNLSPQDWKRLTEQFDSLQDSLQRGLRDVHRHIDSASARSTEQIIQALDDRLAPPPPAVRHVLPRLPEIYVRRVAKLQALHAMLTAAKAGVSTAVSQVVASGFGGYGKSLLAIGYAYEYADAHFPGGAYFLSVGEVSIEAALARLGVELRLPDLPAETAPAAAQTRAHLAALPERSLVIVDNVEASQYQDAGFRDALPRGKVCLLFTTRDKNLLPLGSTLEVDRLTQDESVELLGKFRSDALQPEHRPAVNRIYAALEGVAVGIAAVGAYLGIEQDLPIADYTATLEGQPPDQIPDGMAAVAAQIDYRPNRGPGAPSGRLVLALRDAYEAQSKAAKFVLNLASVLPQDLAPRPWIEGVIRKFLQTGHLTVPARPGFADPLVPLFAELARGDFLRASDSAQPVLVMHRLHRALIRARLRQSSSDVFTALQIALAFAARERAPESLQGERWREPERRWEVEPVIAFSAAFAEESLAATGASDLVLNSASVLSDMAGRLELALGRIAQARASFARGLEVDRRRLANNPDDRDAHRNLSVSLDFAADLERNLSGPAAAIEFYRESLAISRRIVERFGESPQALRDVAISLGKVGDAEVALTGPSAAIELYRESLDICRRSVARFGETPESLRDVAISLSSLGDAERALTGPAAAIEFCRESLVISRRIVERFGESPQALRDVSVALIKFGDAERALTGPAAAIEFYRESLDVCRRIVERFDETPEALRDLGVHLERMAITRAMLGDKAGGLADAREALRLHESARQCWGAGYYIDETISKTNALIAHIEAM